MAFAIMTGVINTEYVEGKCRCFLSTSYIGPDVPDGFQNYNVPVDLVGDESVQSIRQLWTAAIQAQAVSAGYTVTGPTTYMVALEKGA